MLCRVRPGSLRGGRRQLGSIGHAWLSAAWREQRGSCVHPRRCCCRFCFRSSSFQHTLFPSRCRRCETSAWLSKAGVGLHQAVVAEVAPVSAAELFCCLSSFIFAPSCSPVLCAQGSPAPLERLGACGY